MSPISSTRLQCSLFFIFLLSSITSAHIVMTYPGWRGDNLVMNGTVADTNGLVTQNNLHPYGMQWEYPCGGMPTTTNRTKWPIHGGAVAFQPGWFLGHSLSVLYINMGNGTIPTNMSLPMVGSIAISGPVNDPYPNLGICFPQVPLPVTYQPQIGENATIQVIMLAQHGAALYSCVDITFADPSEVEPVTKQNCFNDTDIVFQTLYQTATTTGSASSVSSSLWATLSLVFIMSMFL